MPVSIRTKLPLFVGAVILGVAGTLAWTSYREVRRLAMESAEARLRTVAAELSGVVTQQRIDLERTLDSLVDDGRIAGALRLGVEPPRASLERLEHWLGTQTRTVGGELWTGSGVRVSTLGAGSRRTDGTAEEQPAGPPEPGYSPFEVVNDTIVYRITHRIVDNDDTVGSFTHTRQLTGSDGARTQLRALTGVDARLLIGSPASGIWHDLRDVVPPPPVDTRDTGLLTYDVDGSDYLAVARAVVGTPWVVTVEFANKSVLADSRAFIGRLVLTGGFVTLLAIAGGWVVSRQITAPLKGLTRAVRRFAEGDHSTRVDIDRQDELGQLGRAFNMMAVQVGEQQDALARAYEDLRQSEERLRLVGQGTLDGLWDWNIVKGTTFYSPRFRELLDEAVHDDLLQTLRTHVHPDDRGATLDAIQDHLEHQAPMDIEARFVSENGAVRWFRIRGQAARDETGRAVRLAGSIIDVTRRRRAEHEVRALNAALEQRVEERTAALTAANSELEAFTYSVSHDLRAPLRQANGFAQLLAEEFGDQLTDEARHYVTRIRESAVRMSSLVDDLLRLSRVGRQPVDAREVSLAQIVQTVRSELTDETRDRAVEWKIGPLPTLTCDPNLIKQAFVNLLDNALKYSRTRERTMIEIGSTASPHEVVVYVRDNGVGFDPAYADKLFGVFQRLHRAEEFEGTGVGLAIVQRIAHRHGGRIWAESDVDTGATFYLALPLKMSVPAERAVRPG